MSKTTQKIKNLEKKIAEKDTKISLIKRTLKEIRKIKEKKLQKTEKNKLKDLEKELNKT